MLTVSFQNLEQIAAPHPRLPEPRRASRAAKALTTASAQYKGLFGHLSGELCGLGTLRVRL